MMDKFEDYEHDSEVDARYGSPDYDAWELYLDTEKTNRKKGHLVIAYHLICAAKHLSIDKARHKLNTYTLANYKINGGTDYISGARKNDHYSEPSEFGYIYGSEKWESTTPIQKIESTLNTDWAEYVCQKIGVKIQKVRNYLDQFSSEVHAVENRDSNAHPTSEINMQPLNNILYGPPGTGKTYHTVNRALSILDHQYLENHKDDRSLLKQRFDEFLDNGRIEFVTFHQSFSYEEFVEGLRASTNDAGQVCYSIEDGVFKKLCQTGMDLLFESDVPEPIVLIIDEINRGNIANILGELITLIEPGKRAGMDEALEVILPYSKEKFSVPANLYIIGTMNTADRSIAHIDTALRRRFQFDAMMPDIDVLAGLGIDDVDGVDIQRMLETINARIELLYDREHTLGHSFFMPLKESPDIETLANIFQHQIFPLLEEYFFEDWGRIRQVLGDDIKSSSGLNFYVPAYSEREITGLFQGDSTESLVDKVYRRNSKALLNPAAYTGIYSKGLGKQD